MRKSRWPVWTVIALLVGAALACSIDFSTAHIKDARMTHDQAGETKTKAYGPDDTFYCVVELANAPDDTQTKAIWKVVEVEGWEPGYEVGRSEVESGSATLTFEISPETSWPPGDYKVELYLDGEKKETLEFKVQ
jgi:hypothetical protein